MSNPFIIWCCQRTGSISLFDALSAGFDDRAPRAQMEPFDYDAGDRPRQFSHVRTLGPAERDRQLREICDQGHLIKHCFENLPAAFNHALAEISTRAGYRHVHLWRRDELARLVSKGLAEQHGTWVASDWTRQKIERWRQAGRQLAPLDIPALLAYHELCESRWRPLAGLLRARGVISEELFAAPGWILADLAKFIGLSRSSVPRMCLNFGRGQQTSSVWDLIPNLEELKTALEKGSIEK